MTATSANYKSVTSVGQPTASSIVSYPQGSQYVGFLNAAQGGQAPNPAPNPVPPTTIDDPHVYPNPFRPGRGDTDLRVSNLPAGTEVGIYTYAGEHVRTLHADDNGILIWDAKNRDGDNVVSGVYFGFVKHNSSRKVIKLAVER
jgi:hypothetical protein